MTETEKINKAYVEGKISSWEHYRRVKESIAKRREKEVVSTARRNGRFSLSWKRFRPTPSRVVE